MMINNSPM